MTALVAADVIRFMFDTGRWDAYREGPPVQHDQLKINSHSVDVSLGENIAILTVAEGHDAVDPYDPNSYTAHPHVIDDDGFVLQPTQFMLGVTRERFCTDKKIPAKNDFPSCYVTQLYDGRSTTGRISIQSHMTAGYGDFGFAGYFTLEIAVKLPMRFRKFMRIGQVSFVPLLSWAEPPESYSGVYRQLEPVPTLPILGPHRF